MMKLTLSAAMLAGTAMLAGCAENPPPPPPPGTVAVSANGNAYVCTKWDNGICVSTHRVKGTPPYAVGYVFGPNYTYTAVTDLPQPLVTYYSLGPNYRYVYSNGYLYEVDPTTYAVVKVIDTYRP